jgi:hypothetical protein
MHISIGQNKVLFIIQEGAITHKDGAIVTEPYISQEALEFWPDFAAVNKRISMFKQNLGDAL